ncbi:MAG: autotransporter domain-containing protein [Hyphomicrobiaceae bacterium]
MATLSIGLCGTFLDEAQAENIIVNGSFETGDFTGWDTIDLASPYSALAVRTAGPAASHSPAIAPTDGTFTADHGFDGGGPGTIEISQVVTIPASATAVLIFDWRAGWSIFGSQSRTFDVIVEPAGGGAPLLTSNILSTASPSDNADTGPQTATVNLSAFSGQSVRVRLSSFIPEDYSGPAHLQIDNVVLEVTVTEAPVDDPGEDPIAEIDTGPTDHEIAERTGRAITNFVARRADQITANEVELVERLKNKNNGGGAPGGAVSFTGEGGSGSGLTNHVEFSTSLQQMVAARQASEDKQHNQYGRMMGLGADSNGSGTVRSMRFDVWARGTWADVDSFTAGHGIGLFYLGADYKFSENFLLGVVTQFDWTDEKDVVQGVAGEGNGWLAGPYVVMRLHDNLWLDASARWGKSDNSVTLANAFASSGDYDTRRWLVTGTLTGDYTVGRFNIAPSVGVLYFDEDQDAFANSLGILVPGRSVTLGRVTFGPKVSTDLTASDGTIVSPFVSVKGLWDFEHAKIVDLTTGLAAGSDELRARVEGGASFQLVNGLLIAGEGFYDGLGADDFEAYGGSVNVVMPLN